MQPNIEIRKATLYDIDSLSGLLQQLFTLESDFEINPDKQKRGLETLLMTQSQGRALLLVAEQSANIIAMCSCQELVSTAEGGKVGLVEDVIVDETMRGQGVGKALLAQLQQWATGQGMTRLQLLADKSNQDAIDFYHHQSWQSTQLVVLRKIVG